MRSLRLGLEIQIEGPEIYHGEGKGLSVKDINVKSRILITGKKIGKGLKYFEKDFFLRWKRTQRKEIKWRGEIVADKDL